MGVSSSTLVWSGPDRTSALRRMQPQADVLHGVQMVRQAPPIDRHRKQRTWLKRQHT